jgi:hypothetical protein
MDTAESQDRQKTELVADAQVHQESMDECKSFVQKVIEATDNRFPNRNQLTDLDIFDPTAVPGTEEALADYGTEELKRLHEYFSQTKYLVWDATRVQAKPLDSTALGLDKLQVQWIEIRRKMFDANQMFKQKTPTPSSADQAEFIADFYERMLEEGQGVGVSRFSDDILFLISVFLCVVTSSVVCETGFSKLNLIKTKLRNRLCVPNLDNLMMVLCNGPNFRPGSKEQEQEINRLVEAAWQVWSEAANRNPAKSHCVPRPRSKKAAPTEATVNEEITDLLEVWEEEQDEADSAEEMLSENVAAEAEKAKELRRRRMAAVGPYVMPEVRRGQGWEICEVPDWAAVEKGMHLRAFMKGKEWRIAALFEDKWWDGTLVSRAGKKHKQFPLHYVVKYPDGREAYSPLPCASYGVDGEWLIIVKSRVKK